MEFSYYIDIIGVCNLRCPSCPVGNSPDAARPGGLMSRDVYTRILEKIRRESPTTQHVHLYNWTEPTLHPELADFIRIARERHLRPMLSTNLNHFPRMDEVVAAEPYSIRISLSGGRQETYGRTHRRGKIDAVVKNMRELRATVDRYGSKTLLKVAYHCYADNLGEDYDIMADLCRELGILLAPSWAYLMPLEKNLEYFDKGLEGDDAELVKLLAVDPKRAKQIALANPSPDCALRSARTAINCDGSVPLCCTVYDAQYDISPSFLDTSHEELQRAKYADPTCQTCMAHGMHDVFLYANLPAWAQAARERIPNGRIPPALEASPRRKNRRARPRFLKRLRRAVTAPLRG